MDKELPWIRQALDARYVAHRWAEQWPWLGEILHCVRRDTKYLPKTHCLVAYELLVRSSRGSPRSHFGVVEVTPAGVRHRLATDDPGLPGLAALCDPEAVGARCAEIASVEECEVTIVRYKPGVRCVLRIDCTGPEGGRLFAKAFHHGAREQAETLARLYALDDPGLPGFAMPVALWSDWAAIVQREVAGTLLHAHMDGPDRASTFHACGRHLAGLHGATIDGPRQRHAEDAVELATYASVIAQADAALADRFAALTARLEGVETELVPSHGALRTDAFLLPAAGSRPVLIDLDGFCRADPARDLGNLLAYLDWRAIRHPGDRRLLRLLADAFLQGYDQVRALPLPERLGRYEAASLLKIVGRRYRSLAFTEWPLVPQLIDLATDLLDGGARENTSRNA
ncbi:MAG: phosphotransferase [Egibacteraceae bacterium]